MSHSLLSQRLPWFLIAALLILNLRSGQAFGAPHLEPSTPLSSTFTYQGRLDFNGTPVTNTNCDFQFSLWNAAIGGSQVGPIDKTGIKVDQGLFYVDLDFGNAPFFDGQSRWLEISVSCPSGSSNYTRLGRQQLTAAPYAIYSMGSDTLDGMHGSSYQTRVSGICNVGNSIRSINLDGTVVCQVNTPANQRSKPSNNITHTLDGNPIVGRYPSITIGADGLGLISYYDYSNGNLKVAHCSDVDCTAATISTLDSSGDQGNGTFITLGTDGLGLISYAGHNGVNNALKVAHCSDLNCTSATITSLDINLGEGTSPITIGADGLGLISYAGYDGSNFALKVAHCGNITCTSATTTILDSSPNAVGGYSSIVLGADGLGLISYYRAQSGELKVAHCSNTNCDTAAIISLDNGNVGMATSIILGSDGLGLIAYLDSQIKLKVAHCSNIDCSLVTISSLNIDMGDYYLSLNLGADGNGIISFPKNDIGYGLMVAHCMNVNCSDASVNMVDGNGSVGRYNSLTIGTDGLPLISYHDWDNGTLKVAHCANPFCVPYLRWR